ncbi:MAG TPA: dienelactone hydrolase family protein [Candidatus Saccharimonadales bacterium]|nr:dienelactone hydrolase family protein [Candidatus Saccharimonadales bacterium]
MKTMIQVPFQGKTVSAYYVASEGNDVRPAVILIHEVWGLADHIKSVAERLNGEGFTVLAPDLLSNTELEPLITPELVSDMMDSDKRATRQVEMRAAMAPLSSPAFAEATVEKLQACYEFLHTKPGVGKIGVIGFCFGGTYSFALAAHEPELAAAVPFYGHCHSSVDELAKVKCPILAFYGEQDHNLIDALPELEANMKQAGVNFVDKIYKDTGHAFFNDQNKATYNEVAAKDAWPRAISFLRSHLS